jgi:hypothetical protein
MIDFLNCDITQIEELERQAYADYPKASILFQALIDLRQELEDKEKEIEELKEQTTIEQWTNENGGSPDDYKGFFEACFEHLDGRYPCPSVTSDYDQGVIFEAIQKGEEARQEQQE